MDKLTLRALYKHPHEECVVCKQFDSRVLNDCELKDMIVEILIRRGVPTNASDIVRDLEACGWIPPTGDKFQIVLNTLRGFVTIFFGSLYDNQALWGIKTFSVLSLHPTRQRAVLHICYEVLEKTFYPMDRSKLMTEFKKRGITLRDDFISKTLRLLMPGVFKQIGCAYTIERGDMISQVKTVEMSNSNSKPFDLANDLQQRQAAVLSVLNEKLAAKQKEVKEIQSQIAQAKSVRVGTNNRSVPVISYVRKIFLALNRTLSFEEIALELVKTDWNGVDAKSTLRKALRARKDEFVLDGTQYRMITKVE
jgi:hypothetical protein